MQFRKWLILGLLFGLLFALESVAVHELFTVRAPGANDFYSRWAGARALLLEGRDPYSLEVTAEIQPAIGIDPSLEGEGKGGFAYPLHVVFTFWPLVYLSYDWVQAIWMVTLQWVTLAIVLGLVGLEQWHPSPLGLAGMVLAALFLYVVTRSIMLGQFTLHVTLFLVLALLALQRGHDIWAGVALAATSVKPQMVIFVAPWLILWAVGQHRWRFIAGLVAGGMTLLLGSLALFPRWPVSFVEDTRRYSEVAGGRNPLAVLVGLVWPQAPGAICYGLAGVLLLAMLAAWRQGWRSTDRDFSRATRWAVVISLLVPFQTGTTNQVMLLIPLLAWLKMALRRWRDGPVAIGVGVVELALWGLFFGTMKGNWENPIMFLPLPLLSLIILIGAEIQQLWINRQPESCAKLDRVQ
jgi:hypothetical protein